MEFDTHSSTVHQKNHLSEHQVSQNNISLFEKNLYRINESLKYVNQYYTPNFEEPVENHIKDIEINELSEPVNDKIDESLKFFDEFYKISMNEIESIRKTEVRKIVNEKAHNLECKRKECNKKQKLRNTEFMQAIREALIIDNDYSKRLLDSNDSELKIRLHEEQIKFDQTARNIKFNLALKLSSSLIDDLKKMFSESRNMIAPQLLENHIKNFMVLEKDLNKFKILSQNCNDHNIVDLNKFVQSIQIFKEQVLKCISNKPQLENYSSIIPDNQNNENIPSKKKSDEAQNEINNFRFTLDDNLEVKSNDLVTFSFKIDEKADSCKNDISNFSFVIDSEKPNKIKISKSYGPEDGYKQILENYFILKEHLKKIENSYYNFLHDENCKSLRQELNKSINTPVNCISSISSWHMNDKFEKLDFLLKCKTVKTGNSVISANCHENALAYCKDTLAQKVINIGEHVASVKTETAFEVSSVITELWQVHPDFGLLLYTRFKQKCPWLIPQSIAKTNDQTDEDYYKSLGYIYKNGIVESQDKYVKRMTGIIRLFASFLVTRTRSGKALGIGQAWMLLAATVNLNPQFDITAVLLYEMLVITGYYLKQAYGRQFIKMLRYIDVNYMKKIDEVTPVGCGGPVHRLKTLISKVIKTDCIDKPKGIIPDTFW